MSNKIKRPMNVLICFLVKKREQKLFNKNQNLKKVAEIAKLIGNHWKNAYYDTII